MKQQKKKKIELFDVIIFLIPFLIFGFILYVYYPGIMSFDSFNQLEQISSGVFTPGHPFIHTFIEWICLKLWNSTASIALFQILIFCITWTIICKYNRKSDSKKVKILQIILSLLLSLNFLISTYMITLWKDILYSNIILILCFIMEIVIDKKFKINNLLLIILSFFIVLSKYIRFNGLVITILLPIILVVFFFIYDRKNYNWIKIIVCCIAFNYILLIPQQFFNIEKDISNPSNTTGILVDKSIQMEAYFVGSDILTEKELEQLSNYADVSKLKEYNNPYFLDNVKALSQINNQLINEEKGEFYSFVLKTMINHPKETIVFAGKTTSILWEIIPPRDSVGTFINTSIYVLNRPEDVVPVHENTKLYKTVNNLITSSNLNKYIKVLFYSPANYLYLSIIAVLYLSIFINYSSFVFIYKIKRKKYLFLVIVPNILNIIGLTVSLPIQDVRFVFANYLVCFLTLIIFVSYIDKIQFKKKRVVKDE